MRFFPLIWAGLMRKKARLIFTVLAVTAAFILFGISIGFDASLKHLADLAHEDRIVVGSRFGSQMPKWRMANQIARLPGVKLVALQGVVGGYFRIPRNNTCVIVVDPNFKKVFPELPVTEAQLHELDIHPDGAIYSRSMAQRWNLKVGDKFPITSPGQPRSDGSQVWTFQVLAIVDDIPLELPAGFAIGSLNYFDKSRIPATQSQIGIFRASWPTALRTMAKRLQVGSHLKLSPILGTPHPGYDRRNSPSRMAPPPPALMWIFLPSPSPAPACS